MVESWKEIALQAVLSLGGREIQLEDIYKEVTRHPRVTPYYREPWKPGGQPRYQCWTRRVLTELVREGKLIRVSMGSYSVPT